MSNLETPQRGNGGTEARVFDSNGSLRRLATAAQASVSAPIFLSSVYRCQSPAEAAALLSGDEDGYVYQRDRHPNADLFAEVVRAWHGARWALVTSSGMAALAAVVLAQLQPGDHVLLSSQLYGKSTHLLAHQAARWGVTATIVDTMDVDAVRCSLQPNTRLIVVETLTNPLLRVSPLPELAEVAARAGAALLVDNTFASPILCRPFDWGATWVLESVSKIINGHSDVMLGVLCGQDAAESRFQEVVSTWGLASSPFDCWLALRGATTLELRMGRASDNALQAARWLQQAPAVARVVYPALADHPDALRWRQLFRGAATGAAAGGSMVTFHLRDAGAAERLIQSQAIPFCPSLGEAATTLSHPASTSHRGLSTEQRRALGIEEGTIRLSVGIENFAEIQAMLERALAAVL